jgi:hypothetical protein
MLEEEDVEATLNETLRLLLTRTGQRHEDIARVVGVSRTAMTLRLKGDTPWRLRDVAAVARHFGLSAIELLSGYTAIASAKRLPPVKGAAG